MIGPAALRKELPERVRLREQDLRQRCDADPQVSAPFQVQHGAAPEPLPAEIRYFQKPVAEGVAFDIFRAPFPENRGASIIN